MSSATSVRTPQASPQDLNLIEKGKSFKACVSLALGNHVTNWSQSVPSEAEKQMQLMVERRMQLSQLVQKCGGQHMFTAASAASADEYIKWATEELKKDDGKNAKVRSAAACPLACHALPPLHCAHTPTSQIVIIKTSDDAGMGNRLQAMVSAFLFAVVTKRVLLVDWAENGNSIVRACSVFSAACASHHAP